MKIPPPPQPPPLTQQPQVSHGLLIVEDFRSHSDTPQSVGYLWTGDQPDAKTSTWQHTKVPMLPEGFEPTITVSERPKMKLDKCGLLL